MATDDRGPEKSNLDQTDTEGRQLDGWIAQIEDEENIIGSLDNIKDSNCCEVQIMEEDVVVDKSVKRGREEDEQSWTKVEGNRGKKLKQIKKEVFIWSKEKLPKQFAIAKLFNSMGLTDINHIKYINPYKLKIEVSTEECAGKFLECQEFQTKAWKVYSAMDVNISYGIIRDVDLGLSDEEALKAITCPNDIEIATLKRLQRRTSEGQWVPSEVAKVGFRGSHMPGFIYVDCLRAKVEPYVFPVTQCSKCWKFGHTKTRCTSKKTICPKCTEEHNNCETTTFKCVNCRGDHMALNRSCPIYAREKRVRELMSEYNCTYHVACNMYVRPSPKPPISVQTVRDNDKLKTDTNNSFSSLLQDTGNKHIYTPSQFPPLFTQKRPKSPQERNKNKQLHSQSIDKTDWWGQRDSPDCIPKQSADTDNDLGDNVNSDRQVHLDELITRLKDIIFMRDLSFKEKFNNVIKFCIEWLIIVVVDRMSEWPILNKCLEFIFGLST